MKSNDPCTALGVISMILLLSGIGKPQAGEQAGKCFDLPEPHRQGQVSLEEALQSRRSKREFRERAVSLEQVSQLLWAAQGVTDPEGLRTAPSAGALYPLEIHLSIGNVEGLPVGIYRYRPEQHVLERTGDRDVRGKLSRAALHQGWIRDGAAVLVIMAHYNRTTRKYGERGRRYVHMEAGHAAQNICLQAVSLGLGTTVVGAFDDEEVRTSLNLQRKDAPLCIMPVGYVD